MAQSRHSPQPAWKPPTPAPKKPQETGTFSAAFVQRQPSPVEDLDGASEQAAQANETKAPQRPNLLDRLATRRLTPSTPGPNLQAKAEIACQDDTYEQDVAREAKPVRTAIQALPPEPPQPPSSPPVPSMTPTTPSTRVMRSETAPTGEGEVNEAVEDRIQSSRGRGQAIAADIHMPIEQAFGQDFSGVRIHANTEADQLNQAVQAKAFTTGNDIYFKQGEYRPESPSGQELLAHELTHVVQQTGPKLQLSSDTIQRDGEIEAAEQQLEANQSPAEARIDRAYQQARELYAEARPAAQSLAAAAQEVIQQLTQWQRTHEADIDPGTLEEAIGSSIASTIFDETVGLITGLWKPLEIGYKILMGVVDVGMAVRQHYQLTAERISRDRSRRLADSTRGEILEQVLDSQHAATCHVGMLFGAIEEHASRAPGAGRQQREADTAAALEGVRAGTEEGDLTGRDVEAVEREGLQSLDAAERAEQLLEGMRVALGNLRAAPARFQQDSQLLLIRTELLFGQQGGESSTMDGEESLTMDGELGIMPDGSKYLRISDTGTNVTTPMNWNQLQEFNILISLNVQLIRMGMEPQIFSAPALASGSAGATMAIQMDESGNFLWGMSDQDLGMFMTQSGTYWLSHVDPDEGGQERREQASEVGQAAKRQIRSILLSTPSQDLYTTL